MTAENRPTDAVPDVTPDLTEPEQDVLDDASTGDVPNAYDGGFDGTESHEPAEPTQRLEETSARDADWADPDAGDASDESQGAGRSPTTATPPDRRSRVRTDPPVHVDALPLDSSVAGTRAGHAAVGRRDVRRPCRPAAVSRGR